MRNIQAQWAENRARIIAALAKPQAPCADSIGIIEGSENKYFDPWVDLISNIHGSYASESDELMIAALIAVRDQKTFEFIAERGFVAEFALYVLSGNRLTDYGTSPRGGFPDHGIHDLWQDIIDKWEGYAAVAWGGEDWR